MGLIFITRPIFYILYVTYITYYLLSHKDNNIISTNKPVTPPDKNELTKVPMLATTFIPNHVVPNTICDSTATPTNDPSTPAIPPNTSLIVPKMF